MHIEMKLTAEKRDAVGSTSSRKLRKSGRVPGNLYGHKQAAVPFSVAEDDLMPVVRSGHKVLDLDIGGSVDKTMIQEVQWDTFGTYIKHIDLLRVDPNERLTVHVPIDLRGTAPGTLGTGVLEQGLRSLTVECLAYQMPDNIPVKINNLQLNEAIHVKDVEVPPNMKILDDPEAVVVRVVQMQVTEAVTAAEGPVQPELIGRKPTEEEAEPPKK